MFIENRIVFGYGTVGVSADVNFRALILEYLEPPSPVGNQVTAEEYKNKTQHGRVVFYYKEDMKELIGELKDASAEKPIIEFRGHLFDFSNFNPESVKVVREMVSKAIMGNPLTWAC